MMAQTANLMQASKQNVPHTLVQGNVPTSVGISQSQISAPQGGGACPNCGQGVGPGQKFCPGCGSKVGGGGGGGFCPGCGNAYQAGQKFCPGCGNKLA
jgi:predicted amidophosphoribosyltransferase